MPNENFQLVTAKKRKRSQKNREQRVGIIHSLRTEERIASNESLVGRIKTAQHEIVGSEFYTSLLSNLELGTSLIGKRKLTKIICYGLGHFADCVVSRYQLGLLLALKDHLCAGAEVHDPVFDRQECELLRTLGCLIILENEEGRRTVDGPTLAYFPHCPRQLTNNFLWANWGVKLSDCILLANSLAAVVEATPRRILNETRYIHLATEFCQEISIDNTFRHKDIFNDSALHVFPARGNVEWNRGEKPEYPLADTELITARLVGAIDCTVRTPRSTRTRFFAGWVGSSSLFVL